MPTIQHASLKYLCVLCALLCVLCVEIFTIGLQRKIPPRPSGTPPMEGICKIAASNSAYMYLMNRKVCLHYALCETLCLTQCNSVVNYTPEFNTSLQYNTQS